MTFSGKAAGLSYNFYLSVASRVLRKSLKDGKQAPWVESEIKIQKWTNGKAGEAELLSRVNNLPKPTGTTTA